MNDENLTREFSHVRFTIVLWGASAVLFTVFCFRFVMEDVREIKAVLEKKETTK